MKKPEHQVLIVGAGVSGCSVATELARLGIPSTIYDNYQNNHASKVAGAIVNPVHLKYQKVVWKGKECFETARQSFAWCQDHSGVHFMRELPIAHLLHTTGDENDWSTKQGTGPDGAFDWFEGQTPNFIQTKFPIAQVNASFRISPVVHRAAVAKLSEVTMVDGEFNYAALRSADNGVTYNGEHFSDVIFAEGTAVKDNPWFDWLPLEPTKGQLSEVHWPYGTEIMWHKKYFLMPVEGNVALAGSTYHRNDATLTVMATATEDIKAGIGEFYDGVYKVLNNRTGVRPVGIDKRPSVGTHPDHKHLHLFNGMGSRGYLMAPLLAQWLIANLYQGQELPPEIRLDRWKRRWYEPSAF